MPSFQTNRSRPRRLSDPDDEYAADRFAEILATPDHDLDWRQYRALLGPYSTAGTYEEVVYFLPLAFDYVLRHDGDALDLITSLVWFSSQYETNLRQDRLHNSVRDRLRICLAHWTRDLQIIHFDREACRQKGWGLQYNDYVVHSEVVCQCNEDLVRFKDHADLALEFTKSLADHQQDKTKASWFLHYSAARFDAYTPPNDKQIRAILEDRSLLLGAASFVSSQFTGEERQSTYWNDLFLKLELWDFVGNTP